MIRLNERISKRMRGVNRRFEQVAMEKILAKGIALSRSGSANRIMRHSTRHALSLEQSMPGFFALDEKHVSTTGYNLSRKIDNLNFYLITLFKSKISDKANKV